MDYQKKAPDYVLDILDRNNVGIGHINYYAWPQLFNSTCGPRDGCGGDAITTFTIEAYVCNNGGPTVYVCNNMYHFEDLLFRPFVIVKNWLPIKKDK